MQTFRTDLDKGRHFLNGLIHQEKVPKLLYNSFLWLLVVWFNSLKRLFHRPKLFYYLFWNIQYPCFSLGWSGIPLFLVCIIYLLSSDAIGRCLNVGPFDVHWLQSVFTLFDASDSWLEHNQKTNPEMLQLYLFLDYDLIFTVAALPRANKSNINSKDAILIHIEDLHVFAIVFSHVRDSWNLQTHNQT